ncbi:MAG: hypothetical protein ACR2MF_08975 [Chthoniobacterales bacterium]
MATGCSHSGRDYGELQLNKADVGFAVMHFVRNAILTILAALIVSLAVICAISHRDAVNKADTNFAAAAPARATFSRFRVSNTHTLSIYWKLRFTNPHAQLPGVAIWHLRPLGAVEFAR